MLCIASPQTMNFSGLRDKKCQKAEKVPEASLTFPLLESCWSGQVRKDQRRSGHSQIHREKPKGRYDELENSCTPPRQRGSASSKRLSLDQVFSTSMRYRRWSYAFSAAAVSWSASSSLAVALATMPSTTPSM